MKKTASKAYDIINESKSHILQIKFLFSTASISLGLALLPSHTVYASSSSGSSSEVWSKANTMFGDVYTGIVSISTAALVVIVAITTLLTMFSKNSRTVDEARSWRTRAIIAWGIINGLGFLMPFLINLFQGGVWKP